jgi:hypothetical protein
VIIDKPIKPQIRPDDKKQRVIQFLKEKEKEKEKENKPLFIMIN